VDAILTDDVMDLQIHLCQRLVHVLHVLTGRREQFIPVSQQGPYGADVLSRSKGSPQ
jgi:hypothetical protein